MKKSILFKTLIDIFCFLSIVGVLNLSISFLLSDKGNLYTKSGYLTYDNWTISLTEIVYHITFLIAVYHLRKAARHMLSDKKLNKNTNQSLNKSGHFFLYSGIISLILILITFNSNKYYGQLTVTHDTDTLKPLLLIIIGLFLVIQSNTLVLAKKIKDENDLTI
ncbi:MAG: hypothetical protein HRT66_03260 [Flavobacteriaceae bacterium]|nr:hypothetical protein [Flavobacteriaceae bacterium]